MCVVCVCVVLCGVVLKLVPFMDYIYPLLKITISPIKYSIRGTAAIETRLDIPWEWRGEELEQGEKGEKKREGEKKKERKRRGRDVIKERRRNDAHRCVFMKEDLRWIRILHLFWLERGTEEGCHNGVNASALEKGRKFKESSRTRDLLK